MMARLAALALAAVAAAEAQVMARPAALACTLLAAGAAADQPTLHLGMGRRRCAAASCSTAPHKPQDRLHALQCHAQAPVSGGARPVTGGARPVSEGARPVSGGARPVSKGVKACDRRSKARPAPSLPSAGDGWPFALLGLAHEQKRSFMHGWPAAAMHALALLWSCIFALLQPCMCQPCSGHASLPCCSHACASPAPVMHLCLAAAVHVPTLLRSCICAPLQSCSTTGSGYTYVTHACVLQGCLPDKRSLPSQSKDDLGLWPQSPWPHSQPCGP